MSRRGWGDAINRPYARVEIGGPPGLVVYAILAAFLIVVLVLVLAFLGYFG